MSDYNLKKRKDYVLKKDDKDKDKEDKEEEKSKKSKTDKWNGNTDYPSVDVYKNHIYYYCGVTKKTCLKLNNELRKIEYNITNDGKNMINKDKYIYLHINSNGGSIFAALSTIDTILALKVPVISIIEGAAASAATLISVVCDYRIIYPNSYMLIHQLSSSTWGKMDELEDEMKNLKMLMDKIKSIYKTYTKLKEKELNDILKHDIWWDSKRCLKSGLVNEIYKNENYYEFDRKKINL